MRPALLSSLLALAACRGEPRQEVAPPQAAATGTSVVQEAGSPAPVPSTPAASTIPVQFLGVWDVATGTCDPASDLRLDIGEDTITFYESVGTVESVRDDAGTTMITLAMEGEGERWTQSIGLHFFDAGTSLLVIDPERPGDAEQNLRKRCLD